MKYLPFIMLSILLITGCMDDPSSPECRTVDETDFLEENAQKEGVTVTDSGLQYRVIEEGEGDIPSLGNVVFVDYKGSLISGETFIETEELDYFSLTDNILAGIVEGIQLMNEGDTFELVIPSELGYGDSPPPNTPINCGSVLIFELTLDSFLRDPDAFMIDNARDEDIQITESGLQYRIIEEGDGPKPDSNQVVTIRYTGTFTNGHIFDQPQDNRAIDMNLGGVIEGFSEGVQLMNEGSTYEFFLPPAIGYGSSPPAGIPPNVVLIFKVELVSVQG